MLQDVDRASTELEADGIKPSTVLLSHGYCILYPWILTSQAQCSVMLSCDLKVVGVSNHLMIGVYTTLRRKFTTGFVNLVQKKKKKKKKKEMVLAGGHGP